MSILDRQTAGAKPEARASGDEGHVPDAICHRIRAAISEGALPPGTRLPEETVADAFSTSRFFVREALRRLASEGLVELRRNRGAFVAVPTVKEARDVFEARRAVERVTTEIVTRTVMTHQLAALGRQIRLSAVHWAHEDRSAAIAAVAAIHLSLAALAHNGALVAALKMLVLKTSLILGHYGSARTFEELPGHYRALLDCIEAGNSRDAARQVERCLSAMEGGLDFVPALRRHVDLTRLMQRIG